MLLDEFNYSSLYVGTRLSISLHHDHMEAIAKTMKSLPGSLSFLHSVSSLYCNEFFAATYYVTDENCTISQLVKLSKEDYDHNIAFWGATDVTFKEPMEVTLLGNKFV
jgi:hypothetical protein